MNIREMKTGLRYVVTKGSEFQCQVGDIVKLSRDGRIKNLSAGSELLRYFLPEDDKEYEEVMRGLEVEVDKEWVASRRRKALAILAMLDREGL